MLRIFQSGSTLERLARAREFVQEQSPAREVVVVGSTRSAADDFVRELAARVEATAGLHRFSLKQLASRIASAETATRGLVPITATGADAIATRASFEVLRRHELEYFAPVGDRPGFSAALATTIRDLRTSSVTPADLATLGPRGRDLSRLLAEYDRQRKDACLIDLPDLFEIAAQVVENESTDLTGCPVVLIDLAITSRAERQFIAALAAKSPQVFATLVADDSRTMAALTGLGAEYASASKRFFTSLERLQNHLFEPLPDSTYEEDGMVQFFSAPGEGRECIEIARRIHEQARNGIPFDHIAVVVRSPQTYAALLQAALGIAHK